MSQNLPADKSRNLGKFLHARGAMPRTLASNIVTAATPKPSAPQPAKKNMGPVKKPMPLSGFGIQ